MEESSLDLSVVVCTCNSAHMISDCLTSVRANNVREVILVDGGSTDDTRKIAEPFVDKMLDDGRRGLANARNTGLDAAHGKYIVFVGPDNIIPSGSLKRMIEYFEEYGCSTVSALTALRDTDSYLGWAHNIYRMKYKAGYKDVVGTPTLFETEVLRKYRYDVFMTNSDDTDLCTRMARDGHRFAISDAKVYEIGFTKLSAVFERWTRYGRGDCLFYLKYHKEWPICRKLRSWLHPFMTDFVVPIKNAGFVKGAAIMPFLILITVLRYYGWVKTAIKYRKKDGTKNTETTRPVQA